jgi:hypothetical protein
METRQRGNEIWLALVAILFITMVYLFMMVIEGDVPQAGSIFGHALGILGFLLMLMTEILYPLRKRRQQARGGRIASWLQFHIFTGLVGPFMVLLHTSWVFNGLPGIVTLLTIIIVISGFGGRYIYTAIPRTADGIVIEAGETESKIDVIEGQLKAWQAAHPASQPALARGLQPQAAGLGQGSVGVSFPSRPAGNAKAAWEVANRSFKARERAQYRYLEKLVQQRDALHRQLGSLATMRRLLSLWHILHIPIGLGLFITAFVHIISAVYFAFLAR